MFPDDPLFFRMGVLLRAALHICITLRDHLFFSHWVVSNTVGKAVHPDMNMCFYSIDFTKGMNIVIMLLQLFAYMVAHQKLKKYVIFILCIRVCVVHIFMHPLMHKKKEEYVRKKKRICVGHRVRKQLYYFRIILVIYSVR